MRNKMPNKKYSLLVQSVLPRTKVERKPSILVQSSMHRSKVLKRELKNYD